MQCEVIMRIERTDNYTVHSYDCNMNGQLSFPALSRFLQEIAWRNAEDMHFGFSDLKSKGMAWVLFRQYIEMSEWPEWGDTFEITTWPSVAEKLFCYREFEVTLNGKTVGRISSSWLVIDLASRRPVRTTRFYSDEHSTNGSIQFPEAIRRKLKWEEEPTHGSIYTVGVTDIDVNNHVNNSRYPEWCMNSYPIEFYRNHLPEKIELQFTAEAVFGDALEIYVRQQDKDTFMHSIQREGKELFSMKIGWRES